MKTAVAKQLRLREAVVLCYSVLRGMVCFHGSTPLDAAQRGLDRPEVMLNNCQLIDLHVNHL